MRRPGWLTHAFVGLMLACAVPAVAGLAQQIAAGGPAPGPSAAASADAAAAVSGVVLDGGTSQPLAGAVVALQGPIATPGTPAAPVAGRRTRQVTDATGRFVFTGLPAGEYSLTAGRVGYAEGGFGRDVSRTGRRIALSAAQWFGDARIVLNRYNAIDGTLTDEAGEPVVGAYVRAMSWVPVSGHQQPMAGLTARTDDRGAYRIPGLPPGRYVIQMMSVQWAVPADTSDAGLRGMTDAQAAAAEAAGRPIAARPEPSLSPDPANRVFVGIFNTPPPPVGGRLQTYPATFYPGVRTLAEAQTIDLRDGQDQHGIDLQIRPVSTVRVSGVVRGPADAVPAGMTLRLIPAGLEGLANGSETATALVAPDGTFTFPGVPTGDYTLSAERSEMEYRYRVPFLTAPSVPSPPGQSMASGGGGIVSSAPNGVEYSFSADRGSTAFSARMPISVGTRDLTSVEVTLTRTVTISGQLVYEVPRQATGTSGLPIYAEPANGSAALGLPAGRQVYVNDLLWTFSIDGLLPGAYALRVFGPSFTVVRSIMAGGRDYTNRPFDASTGRDIADVVITFTDKVAKLNGFVRAGPSTLSSSGAVIAFPAEPDEWTDYGFTPRRILTAAISSNGSYRFTALPAGDYNLIAVDDGEATGWQEPAFLAAAATAATRITLDWGETKSTDLTIKTVTIK